MMFPVGFSETMLAFGTGGVGVGAGIYIMRMIGHGIGWLLTYLSGRQDKREADADRATASAVALMREEMSRMAARLSVVEHELEECKKLHRDTIAERDEIARERAELQGLLAGLGGARQHAQLIIAAEKVGERIGRDEAERAGEGG